MPVLEPRHLSSPRQTTNEIDALLHVALGESNFGRASMGAAPEQERVAHTPHPHSPPRLQDSTGRKGSSGCRM